MADKEYDVSDEMLKLFKIKQKARQESKAYYQRFVTNPHRPIGDGIPFDPVAFRLNALGPYQIEHFKPTPRNFLYFIGVSIIPIVALYMHVSWETGRRERNIRSGRVAYKDRMFKLIQ